MGDMVRACVGSTPKPFWCEIYQVFQEIKDFLIHYPNPASWWLMDLSDHDLIPISAIKRASYDQQILESHQKTYAPVLACNGNGVCFNYASDEILCPSYKATKAYSHS